ncbi:MAG: hypothetical protein MUD01_24600 [Chloroflexaceae bacterium]|nr:hypothetical protein [Chloroflexaceae bacterium]
MTQTRELEDGHEPGLLGQPEAELQAICGLCGAPLEQSRDDIYAELCAVCGQRQLKGRAVTSPRRPVVGGRQRLNQRQPT